MKIIVTGSKGMLGQYITQVFSDCDLICLDRKELDITNENEVNTKIAQIKPDVIINCAAYNNVDKAESESELANLINGYAVGYLAKAAKKVGALFVHFSTNYVFSGDNKSGYSEEDKPDPQSAYGASKLLGEQEARKYADKYYIIRTARLFGKQGSTDDVKKSFVDLILETAEKNNYKIKAVDEEYDLPTYGFDLALKTREIIESSSFGDLAKITPQPPLSGGIQTNSPAARGVSGVSILPYGIYHVVNSGEPCTWHSFAREIFDIMQISVEIEKVSGDAFGKRPAKRLKYGALKNTKLKPMRDWRKTLLEYLIF
ncbi:MAG: dTDP-4-dehydrorhamnose reductase [bacterium]